MAGRSASCYGTSGRGKGDVVFTNLNISDYEYYCKFQKGDGFWFFFLLNYR